jgi:uncharacterized protein YpmB
MRKRHGLRAILLLPITTVLFVVGWIMYRVQSKPQHTKKAVKPENTSQQDIQFVMIDEEQNMLETYAE